MAELHCGDAEAVMMAMPDESVDSVVTSPPYADARGDDYEHVGVDEYASWTARWAAEAFRVSRHSMMLNIGRLHRDGEQLDYHLRALSACRYAGWLWLDEIIWRKTNCNPLSGKYLTDAHEHVYWLAKTTDPFRGYDEVRTPYAAKSVGRVSAPMVDGRKDAERSRTITLNPLGARPSSVFECATGHAESDHPAPMPLPLAEHLVRLSTPYAGVVLDPFGGGGTTGIAAVHTGRISVLIEHDANWLAYAEKRITEAELTLD